MVKVAISLSFLSLVFGISLVDFEQGISLIILVFSLSFLGFCGFGSERKSLVNLRFVLGKTEKWKDRVWSKSPYSEPDCTGIMVRGVTWRGGGYPLGTASKHNAGRARALIRIRDVSRPVWIRIKMPCLYHSRIQKNPERVPERAVAPDTGPRTHFRGTPLCGTPFR